MGEAKSGANWSSKTSGFEGGAWGKGEWGNGMGLCAQKNKSRQGKGEISLSNKCRF